MQSRCREFEYILLNVYFTGISTAEIISRKSRKWLISKKLPYIMYKNNHLITSYILPFSLDSAQTLVAKLINSFGTLQMMQGLELTNRSLMSVVANLQMCFLASEDFNANDAEENMGQ